MNTPSPPSSAPTRILGLNVRCASGLGGGISPRFSKGSGWGVSSRGVSCESPPPIILLRALPAYGFVSLFAVQKLHVFPFGLILLLCVRFSFCTPLTRSNSCDHSTAVWCSFSVLLWIPLGHFFESLCIFGSRSHLMPEWPERCARPSNAME